MAVADMPYKECNMNAQWKLAVGAAAVAASSGAQAGIVDLFTTEQLVPKDFTNGTITEADSEYNQAGAVADATILGGFRDLWVTNLSGGITNVAGSSINVTAGNLFFSTDSSATGVGEIQWDGDDSATGVNQTSSAPSPASKFPTAGYSIPPAPT
jgi:hypothetical protein